MSLSLPATALPALTSVSVNASVTTAPYGSPITLTASVTSGGGTPYGTVIFLSDLVSLGSVTLDGSGQATLTTSALAVGLHAVVAVYLGNLDFLTSTAVALNVNISLAVCTINVVASLNTVLLGATVNLTATVTGSGGTPTGLITFRSGLNVLGNATLDGSGQGVLAINTTLVGLLSIGVDYSGDTHFLGCIAPIIVITVNPGTTSVSIASSANPAASGASVTFTSVVSGTGGTPTGTVTFRDGATAIGTGSLNGGGQASISTSSLGTGSHSITASYAGDSSFTGATSAALLQVINPATSTAALSSSANPAALGSPVTLTAALTSSGATPTGTVTFKDGATTIGTGVLNGSGAASLVTSSLVLGSHSITAVYPGDSNVAASTSSPLAQIIVQSASTTGLTSSANPSAAGAAVTFTAAVTGTGGTPTGSVTFKDGGTVLGTATLDGTGHTSFTASSLPAGTHPISAVYGGDSNFASSTSPVVNQISGQASSTTALNVAPNPAAAGAPVVFTATVTGVGSSPTGTVTFRDGGSVIGSSPLNGSGTATLTSSSLAAGNHSITATYGGDATFASSLSPAVMLGIAGGPGGTPGTTSTTLSSSANPGVFGQPVVFTASVTSTTGSPIGLVTFKDGGQTIGSAPLSGTTATLAIATLSVGQHSITATYAGNTSSAASTSAALPQSISVPPDSIKLRKLQLVASRIAAQNAGDAIAGTIKSAISEGFAGGDQLITPSELGLRMTSSGKEASDWLLWSDLRQTSINPGGARSDITGNQVNAFVGVTYRVTPDGILGIFGGYETFGYDVTSLSGHLHGDGLTAGAYIGWRFLPGVRFDVGVARSEIGYRGAAGEASANFSGTRTFVTTGITGTYNIMRGLDLEPSARIYGLWEDQGAYTDSLRINQSQRSFSTGRGSVGAKLIYKWLSPFDMVIAPYAGVYADDYFNKDDAGLLASPNAVMTGASARLVGGVAFTSDRGLRISTGGEVGGLAGNFTTWSFRTRGSVPF